MSQHDGLRQASHRRSSAAESRARASIELLRANGQPISFSTVARHASVSRTFLYEHPGLRHVIMTARRPPTGPVFGVTTEARDEGLLVRLQQAHQRLEALRRENESLRAELAVALQRRPREGRDSQDPFAMEGDGHGV